jgi:Cys-rich four helix bundle protein (predicted Tat secretion target)
MFRNCQTKAEPGFDAGRRGALLGASVLAGAAALSALGTAARAEDATPADGAARRQALVDAALDCVNRGSVCMTHCVTMLSNGDTSLKDCMRTISSLLPVCEALARMAAIDARHLRDIALLAIDVCGDCEEQCRRHAHHHAQCKNCADACLVCIKQCKKVTAA